MGGVHDAQRGQQGRAKQPRVSGKSQASLPCEAWLGAQGYTVVLMLATWPEGLQGCLGLSQSPQI